MLKTLLRKNPKLEFYYVKVAKISKRAVQALSGWGKNKTILFIIGCQRSGTTLLTRIFTKDWKSKVYGEFSPLSSQDKMKIRLNPLDTVKKAIDRDKANLVVLKPLVETQNSLQLLDYFPNSKAIWLYRNYKDVASSNIKKFGEENGKNNLRPITHNEPRNWRSENLPDEIREVVLRHFSEDIEPFDAAALFWFVRNRLFFTQNLQGNSRVFMCRYDDMVSNANEVIRKIYDFSGQQFPGEILTTEVSKSSLGKGKDVSLRPEIRTLCEDLMNELDNVYRNKKESVANWP